ncbi:chemotaxis protein CheB [Dyadobacter aurulentus]|uniref:chemotaxis protein CheB n=1 Tax=Dyadobacter sp. UC 10 TaxID=2605428 RepID=UPI0011F2130E|nr:chemotaxis protein CheB [Dyadobacter sp. UC 10]KAA0993166.1 chemotaxis protein CheB [Dyadobacter sp. UC 10]
MSGIAMPVPLSLMLFGGSSGSMGLFEEVLKLVKYPPGCALIFVLHRGKSSTAHFPELFRNKTDIFMSEPNHLDEIKPNCIYFALPDYHLLIGPDHRFYYDLSDKDFFSRPSIDATFSSAAVSGIPVRAALLFSGSSRDGAFGLRLLAEKGFTTYVLDPAEAGSARMPHEALKLYDGHQIIRRQNFTITINDILYSKGV